MTIMKGALMVVLAVALFNGFCLAQTYGPYTAVIPDNYFQLQTALFGNLVNTAITNSINSNMARQSMARSRAARGQAGQSGAKASSPANRTSVPSPTSFRAGIPILPRLVSEKAKGTAKERAELRELVEGYLGRYKYVAQQDGFPANDLAYGMNFYLLRTYLAFHHIYSPLEHGLSQKQHPRWVTEDQEAALFRQFQELFGADPEIKKVTDVEKQGATEALAVMTWMLWDKYVEAVNNSDARVIANMRELARENLESMFKVPAESIWITDNGIEIENHQKKK